MTESFKRFVVMSISDDETIYYGKREAGNILSLRCLLQQQDVEDILKQYPGSVAKKASVSINIED